MHVLGIKETKRLLGEQKWKKKKFKKKYFHHFHTIPSYLNSHCTDHSIQLLSRSETPPPLLMDFGADCSPETCLPGCRSLAAHRRASHHQHPIPPAAWPLLLQPALGSPCAQEIYFHSYMYLCHRQKLGEKTHFTTLRLQNSFILFSSIWSLLILQEGITNLAAPGKRLASAISYRYN